MHRSTYLLPLLVFLGCSGGDADTPAITAPVEAGGGTGGTGAGGAGKGGAAGGMVAAGAGGAAGASGQSAAGAGGAGASGEAGAGGGGSAGAPPVCAPGDTRECVGPGACKGGQACREDGSGWEACDCGGAGAAGQGGEGGAAGGAGVAGQNSAGVGGEAGTGGAAGAGGGAGEGGGGVGGAGAAGEAGAGGQLAAGQAGAAGAAGGGGAGEAGAGQGGAGQAGQAGQAGGGQAGAPPECVGAGDCNDGNACTVDTCEGGACQHAPVDPATYDDGDACTTDVCDPAGGSVHNANWQPDKNPCTADACDKATGQVTRPITSGCWYVKSNGGPIGLRTRHYAAWLGDRMIVMGGENFKSEPVYDGGLYDPVAETWLVIDEAFATLGSMRDGFAFAKDGKLVVTGGMRYVPSNSFSVSGINWFDPKTFAWSGAGGPAGQPHPYMATLAGGGVFAVDQAPDPGLHTWFLLDLIPDSKPQNLASLLTVQRAAAVGSEADVFVYGGLNGGGFPNVGGQRYSFQTNAWTAIPPENPPGIPNRWGYAATWTGSKFAVWGGYRKKANDPNFPDDTGSLYDPAVDTWSEMSMVGAPEPRADAISIWLGDRWFVWGGTMPVLGGSPWTGAFYFPATDAWAPVSMVGAPPAYKLGYSVVWTGEALIFWGSQDGKGTDMALYYP